MAKKDLENESNNLTIIVVLSLFLICSLGYIAYDKFFSRLAETENGKVIFTKEKTEYNKDGIYIKQLMNKVIYHSGINHDEYQLFVKDKVTVEDLSDTYKNTLVFNNVKGSRYTIDNLLNSSQDIFGKGIYTNYPEKINVLCNTYHLRQDGVYEVDPQTGSCGGTNYQYYEKIEKVTSNKDHIYVDVRVGFQCDEGVCSSVEKQGDNYVGKSVVKKLDSPASEVNLDEIKDQLILYRFTFTYDARNNLYYFEKVQNTSVIY